MVTIRAILPGTPEYAAECALREAVLRVPLGLRLSAADTAGEDAQVHLGAFAHADGTLAGCVLLKPGADGTYKLRQMAVRAPLQGQGLGRQLVLAAEALARARGATRITLHARQTAVGFYAKLGYVAAGEPFTEVGIPHREMGKQLG